MPKIPASTGATPSSQTEPKPLAHDLSLGWGLDQPHTLLAPARDQPRERAMALELPAGLSLDDALMNDAAPLPTPDDREGYYGDRHFMYWQSGLKDALDLRDTARAQGSPFGANDAVLDLGCASGRVARHLAAHWPDLEVHGADLNARHVAFCNQYLPRVRCVQNTALPSLPYEDNAFALVSAFSVFTHIDQFETAWLSEVRRVLKPGGLLYATVHTDKTWSRMDRRYPVYQAIVGNAHLAAQGVTAETFATPMPAIEPGVSVGRRVFRYSARTAYNCNVFHHSDYLRGVWGRFMEVVELREKPSEQQDVVVLRKPRGG